jgi:hypothetical protein
MQKTHGPLPQIQLAMSSPALPRGVAAQEICTLEVTIVNANGESQRHQAYGFIARMSPFAQRPLDVRESQRYQQS